MSPKEVIEQLGHPVDIDDDVVARMLRHDAPPDRTPFRGIRRVPPGHTYRWAERGAEPQDTPWTGPAMWSRLRPVTGDPALLLGAGMAHVLGDMVGTDSPLAVLLSSGLDSTFMTAVLAASTDPSRPIHAFVHRPHRDSPRIPDGVGDEWSAAQAMRAAIGDRLILTPLERKPGEFPLDVAADFAARSWLPAVNVANFGWWTQARFRAADLGAAVLLYGGHGNTAFSDVHNYAERHYAARGDLRALHGLAAAERARGLSGGRAWRSVIGSALRGYHTYGGGVGGHALVRHAQPDPIRRSDRQDFERRLLPESGIAATQHPGSGGAWALDPFHSLTMIELAARIRPWQWRQGPGWRALARRAGEGLVPDSIRLAQHHGVQSADSWYLIRNARDRYFDEADLLASTPVLGDLVDLDELRRQMAAWPWGEPVMERRYETHMVNWIFSLAGWMRTMPARLAAASPRVTGASATEG